MNAPVVTLTQEDAGTTIKAILETLGMYVRECIELREIVDEQARRIEIYRRLIRDFDRQRETV